MQKLFFKYRRRAKERQTKMILVVSRKKSHSRELVNILEIVGIVSYPVTSGEVFSEISPMYRAVVVIEPDFLFDVRHFIDTIHSYVKGMPVYALYQDKIGEEGRYFTECFTGNIFSSSMVNAMAKYAKRENLPCPGDYRLAGINATVDLGEILYFGKKINLTKTEAKILRFLIRSYPTPRKAETIIKYLYKPTKSPEPSSIRTHVCKINSKFKELFGEGIICSPESAGYVIYTPRVKTNNEK